MGRSQTTIRVERRAERAALELSPSVAQSAAAYYELLFRWNRTVNLTALGDGEEAIDRLLIEPLVAARHLPAGGTLLDVGSGGGSPAIPLKLALPGVRLIMVESKMRKAAFLREVIRQLGLAHASVEAVRLEDLTCLPEARQVADVVSVRAVKLDRRLLRQLAVVSKPEGMVALFSGPGVGGPSLERPWAFSGERPLIQALGSRLVLLRHRGTPQEG